MTDPRGPAGPGADRYAHQLLLYGAQSEFVAAVEPFVRAGLVPREPVFVATGRRNAALLRRCLGARAGGPVFAPDGWYASPAQALRDYHDKARAASGGSWVVGEMPWGGLTDEQTREWARYESLLTLALTATGARHLCPYDTRALPEAVLRTARLTHPSQTGGAAPWANPAHMSPREFSASCDTVPLDEPPEECAEFFFDGSGRRIAELRGFIAAAAGAAGLPDARTDSLLLCVDEAAVNAVRHGGGHGSCRVWTTDTELLCEVNDPKGALDTALAGYLPPGTEHPDGRGLWIIRQLSDLTDTRTSEHGSTVRIHMRLPGSHPPRPGTRPGHGAGDPR
ncbi:sensor histidine kinase [Streptomyces sp. MST-110588]|uniref:sensor histidine kinase n=1 Tax=Streptomyces sp. MST-110588 TaxID=2833628 RepID=UPI001F5C1BD6|nr:sensor histidine kinase [Streptomyces sp. MST-110588]UNO38813.1 sensor histidine kinase [Streptomyces sp. MST-110588]